MNPNPNFTKIQNDALSLFYSNQKCALNLTFSDLSSAKELCNKMSDCGGVTWTCGPTCRRGCGRYELRAGRDFQIPPYGWTENSYLKTICLW